jgi:hypothetical protein
MRLQTSFGLVLLGIFTAVACGEDTPPPAPSNPGGNVGAAGSPDPGSSGATVEAGQAGELTGSGGSGSGFGGGGAGTGEIAGGAPSGLCNDGKGTTVSGRVLAPNGELPVPGAHVYVSSTTADPPPAGAGCFRCASSLSGEPAALTTTDSEGRFQLLDVPAGETLQLVVQTGKWQRVATLAGVVACQDNPVAEADVRLPTKSSEGNLPSIALVSGGEDTLECLLRKLGIDDSEFGYAGSIERVQLYSAKGGMTALSSPKEGDGTLASATSLWGSVENLSAFDLVILGSEASENAADKPEAALAALHQYVSNGGRVLLQRFQSYFVKAGPAELSGLASFGALADLAEPFAADVDVTSPRGKSMADWLSVVGATDQQGKLSLNEGQTRVESVQAPAVRLLFGTAPATVQAFSVDLPHADGKASCGRLTATDLLTAAGDTIADFPNGCSSTTLSPQEKALGYLLFDAGACL